MQNIEDIYKEYAGVVYKYIFCLARSEDIAEEIVQETFEVAVKDINKFKEDCKVSTWLCQIAKYIWYGRLRKAKKNKEVSLEELENSLIVKDSLEDDIVNKEERMQLFKKLQNLEQPTRDVMYLRILGNLDYSEIAEIMGKTPNWVRVVFFRGKEKMKGEK